MRASDVSVIYIYIDDKGIFVIKSWFLNGRARQEKGIISIKGRRPQENRQP